MRPLLRFTLDLFGQNPAPSPVVIENFATDKVATDQSDRTEPAPSPQASGLEFRHPQASREARLGEALVAYRLRRGRRRTIGFSVGADGLTVSVPTWVSSRQLEAALQDKSGWILRKLADARDRSGRMQARQIDWRDGAELPYLGQPLRLVLDPAHAFGTGGAALRDTAAGACLYLALPRDAGPAQIRDAAQAWLMGAARTLFDQRLNHYAPLLGVQWRRLSLSSAGTRWGSARADGAIRLNWRLVHFRLSVIDYVVVHELSHLRVMDHSPRFWETVRSVVPDYASLRGQLKDEALPRWS
ncbi:MAG: M48 family metallopeptidase [Rhodoferax sp.]|nr:M48 family metallopeptidase [Rhodoferax sp.]